MLRIASVPVTQRHVTMPVLDVGVATVAAALQAAFVRESRSRGYLLDDQGSLHRRMALLTGGVQVRDRRGLGDPPQDDNEIYVVQALNGGRSTEEDTRRASDSMPASARACSSCGATRRASGYR